MFYTYVLKCSDLKSNKIKLYTGSTTNLEERIVRHKSKSVPYTKKYDQVELVYFEGCLDKTDAIKRERQLKTGFGRGYIKRRIENYLKKQH